MRWILRKVASLAGTAVAAVFGLLAAQVPAFIHAYLQRLGGHLDEARRGQGELLNGQTAALIRDEPLRTQLAAITQARIDALDTAHRTIGDAGAFAKPFVFLRHMDGDIAAATAGTFQPALPLDPPSLIFGLAGIVLGWVLWELAKTPFSLLRRGARTRPDGTGRSRPQRQTPAEKEERRRTEPYISLEPVRQNGAGLQRSINKPEQRPGR